MKKLLEDFFQLTKHNSTFRREILGGLTTFLTMSYIIVVNPSILALAGIPIAPSTVATILVAVFGSLFMGFYANRPIAVAPYMGENAFIASLVMMSAVFSWPQLLGAVFVSGVAFLAMTIFGLRSWLAKAVSPSLKFSFAAGIGMFLLLLGFIKTGIVIKPEESPVPVGIGAIHSLPVLLAIGGFLLMIALMIRRVVGAILIGIAVTAIAGIACGLGEAPTGIIDLPADISPIALQLDVKSVLDVAFFPIVLTLFLMSFLDTLGTLMAVGSAGNMLDENDNFPEIEKPMLVDSVACMFAALVGTSTSGAYIESTTGIREGARTGLAAVVTALFFASALFFLPLIEPLQSLEFAYGPALIVVGILMLASIKRIDFEDMTESVPAVITIVMMVFTYNIANGLTAGLALHPILKTAAGRWREVHAGGWVLGAACLLYYVVGVVH